MMRQSFCDDARKLQSRHEYAYPIENGFQFMPFHMVSDQVYNQEFQYFVVIDFEATCDKVMQPNPQEIIEFPSVIVNSLTGQIEDCFQTYVRPTHHPILTDFCKELTGIQQIQVDGGVSLSKALFMHDKWLSERGVKHTSFTIVTWTDWDCRTMLESECRLKGIYKPPYFDRWINLKVPFHEIFGRVRCNLKEAVKLVGLTWEGRAHCGLDDAYNTAQLLIHLMRRGFRFSTTSSMELPQTHYNCRVSSVNQLEKQKEKTTTGNSMECPRTCLDSKVNFLNKYEKQKEKAIAVLDVQSLNKLIKAQNKYCLCGVQSNKCVVHKPVTKQSKVYNEEFQLEEFQYFVVMNFKATCDKVMLPNPQEIIEIPSVIVNSLTGQIEDCFQTYVRPTHHPLLTNFCKELTGIQQTQVDGGVSLSKALFMHNKWLMERGVKHTSFIIVTWTDWDCCTMLKSECRLKGIYKPPYFDRWINLKVPFHEIFGSVRCNLKEAIKLVGLTWEGRAHCGLDDARNTAQLLIHLMQRGFRFSTTSFMELPQTHSSCRVSSMNQLEKQKEKMVSGNLMECPRTCLNSRVNYLNQFEKLKEKAVVVMEVQSLNKLIKVENKYCLGGVKSNKCVVCKPEPKESKVSNFDNRSYPSRHEYANPIENGFQFMSFHMGSDHVYNEEFQLQEFQYFVVMDFEATCDKVMQPNPQEIIEFPSVIVNSLTGQIEDCFQTYVRPTHHPLLTDFCKELTGIQQTQVDGGVSLSKVLIMHDKWLMERGVKYTSFTIVTWTDWDCHTMLDSECRLKGIYKPPYFDRWINLKVPFHEIFGSVSCNLKEAIKLAGLTWEGRAHCGLDDARNTAQLLIHLMRRGFRFSTTSSMELPQTHSNCRVSSMNQLEKQKEKTVSGNLMECPRTCLDSRVNYLNQFEKQKEKAVVVMEVQSLNKLIKVENKYCLGGVKSNKCVVCKPEPKESKVNNEEFQLQEFQYFVVMDFEATCDKVMQPNPQEIIEFPSVIVNSLTGQIEDCFQTYVRPTHYPLLTDFCKELTGIQQTQVDGGVSLSRALFMHDKWLKERGVKYTSFTIVTWTDWDCRTMLESECRLKGIYKPPYFDRWINLKVPFHEIFGRVHCNLKEAVKLAGLIWEGRAHCGLDDARNTVQLLIHLMRRGFRFSTTSSMELPQTHSNCRMSSMNQLEKQKEKTVTRNSMECPRTWLDSKVNYLNQFEKQKKKAIAIMEVQSLKSPIKAENKYCLCGVKSNTCVVHKPGPKQGKLFFSCGNWTASRQGISEYFI